MVAFDVHMVWSRHIHYDFSVWQGIIYFIFGYIVRASPCHLRRGDFLETVFMQSSFSSQKSYPASFLDCFDLPNQISIRSGILSSGSGLFGVNVLYYCFISCFFRSPIRKITLFPFPQLRQLIWRYILLLGVLNTLFIVMTTPTMEFSELFWNKICPDFSFLSLYSLKYVFCMSMTSQLINFSSFYNAKRAPSVLKVRTP